MEKGVKGAMRDHVLTDKKSILDDLELQYKTQIESDNGRSVVSLTTSEPIVLIDPPTIEPIVVPNKKKRVSKKIKEPAMKQQEEKIPTIEDNITISEEIQ